MGVKGEKDLGKQVSFSLQVSILLGWGKQNKRGAPEVASPLEKTGKFEWVPMTQQRPKEPTRKVVGETSSKYICFPRETGCVPVQQVP